MKKQLLSLMVLVLATVACQKSDSSNKSQTGNVLEKSNQKIVSYPSSGPAVSSHIDSKTNDWTQLIYDRYDSEGRLCRDFLNELEVGKTDIIESIPLTDKQKHQILRGCARYNLTGNALILVARSSYSTSRKLEIFQLLIGKYNFPTNLRNHSTGDNGPSGDFSVFNVTVATDDLFPLTEYLVAQNVIGTHVSYPFGYNGGSDWCSTPLVLGAIVPNYLGSRHPVMALRDSIQIKTFRLLAEKKYVTRGTETNNANCNGQYPGETILSFLQRFKDWNYSKVENLDDAINILKTSID